MHTVSVVTLLLASIFAYSMAVPQFYGGNLAGLSTALAQLASQLAAQQRNETIKVGNNSMIVSGIASANANVNTDRIDRPQWNNNFNSNGYYNGYYGNYGYNGYWRGIPEEDNLSEEEAALAEEEKQVAELSAEANQDLAEDDEDVVEQDDGSEEEQDEGHEDEQDEGHEEEQPQEH